MLDRRAVLGAAAAGVLAPPAWAQKPGTTARMRTINAMMTDEPAHLNYPLFNTRIMQEICGNINESLLLFDWQFKPKPNLARGYEMAPDGMRYTIHLRPDVVWHDGAPFTARDVAFTGAGLTELWSMTAVLNTPSQEVMRRIGMTEAARFAHPRVPDGSPLKPHVVYHLASPEPVG